ncbi:MAG: hypothetical protein D6788_09985 [Planctomycetota bacterium]|nr:MAG: hypothetical protein D6788_09985 [Planctomycetota bacterium]
MNRRGFGRKRIWDSLIAGCVAGLVPLAGCAQTCSPEERVAMKWRRQIMKRACPGAKIVVLPVRHWNHTVSREDAVRLAEQLTEKNLCRAEAAETPFRAKLKPSPNEQKVLWELARAFRADVRQNPPAADYVLLADYMLGRPGREAAAVHFIVCDRKGEWVIVDFQNSHQDDFRAIRPVTPDDCAKLVVKRLERYLRGS